MDRPAENPQIEAVNKSKRTGPRHSGLENADKTPQNEYHLVNTEFPITKKTLPCDNRIKIRCDSYLWK